MFKKLRTSTKLLILCGTFGISIAITTAALVAEKEIAIAFARKELVGSRYLATVRDIYPAILIEQDDAAFAQPRPSPDEILKGLATAEADATGRLQTAELEQALAQTLRKLWSDKTVQNTDQLVLAALSNEQKLASRIGDETSRISRSIRTSIAITCRTSSSTSSQPSSASLARPRRCYERPKPQASYRAGIWRVLFFSIARYGRLPTQ